jgi:hypothetical protein
LLWRLVSEACTVYWSIFRSQFNIHLLLNTSLITTNSLRESV